MTIPASLQTPERCERVPLPDRLIYAWALEPVSYGQRPLLVIEWHADGRLTARVVPE